MPPSATGTESGEEGLNGLHSGVRQAPDEMRRQVNEQQAAERAVSQVQRMELPPEQEATLALGRTLGIISDKTAEVADQLVMVKEWVNNPENADSVETLNLERCNLKVLPLELSRFTNLGILTLSNNQLTKLDLSSNPKIYALYIDGNPLTHVEIATLSKLEELWHSFDSGWMKLPTGLKPDEITYKPLNRTQ